MIVEWDNDVDLVGFLQTDNLTKDSNVSHPKYIILLPGDERRSSGLELWVCCQERMGGGIGTRDMRLLSGLTKKIKAATFFCPLHTQPDSDNRFVGGRRYKGKVE